MLRSGKSAPDKWPEVCRTVRHLLRSLRGARKFQVIAFAERVHYPLGAAGEWIVLDDKAPDRAYEALMRIRPRDTVASAFGRQP